MTNNSANTRRRYDRIAPIYDFWDIVPEHLLYSSWRRQLWNGLRAEKILEIGVGTGKNMSFYPPGARVTAIDISPKMLEKAAKRATMRRDISIELVTMDVSALSLQHGVFDAVVGSFILTVLPDPLSALREIKRVCKPGGMLLLLEFTRSDNRLLALLQGLVTPLTYVFYRARINRDILALVATSGFKIISAKGMADGLVKLICAVLPDKNW